jgi:hypothetical protein
MRNEHIISGIRYRESKEFPSYYIGENGTLLRFRDNKFKNLVISYSEKYKHTYMIVQNKKGNWRSIRPYILIAKEFVKNISPKIFDTVGYYDGNERNISANNLYWKSRSNRKLLPTSVKYIKYSIENNTHTNIELARMFNVSDMQISRIKTGENWGDKKYIKKELPFPVKDGKIRRFLSSFDIEERRDYKMKFKVKKNNNSNKLKIIGIVNGHRFTLNHTNITRANKLTEKLNKYFEL